MNEIAVISNGILTLVSSNGTTEQHDSDFGADIERRVEEITQKKAWKQNPAGMFGTDETWGNQAGQIHLKPRLVSVVAGLEPGHFSYILTTEKVGAFLKFDSDEDYETRVFHKENFFASELDRDPKSKLLLCRVGQGNGPSQIARMNPEGRDLEALTEGDSSDGAPSWDRAQEDSILYHSAGLAYDNHGYPIGTSPYRIERLQLKKQKLKTILESETQDFLCPRSDKDGNLYYITRPYEGPGGTKPPILTTIKDTLLFPFRLVRAFVDFFQMFSHIVSQKPLSTAGGPKKNGPEPVALWIHGRLLKPEKESSDGALAPASWKLIKKNSEGEESTLASRVVSYDLNDKGEIIYSDGRNLKKLVAGQSKQIAKIALTEEVCWLTTQP